MGHRASHTEPKSRTTVKHGENQHLFHPKDTEVPDESEREDCCSKLPHIADPTEVVSTRRRLEQTIQKFTSKLASFQIVPSAHCRRSTAVVNDRSHSVLRTREFLLFIDPGET
jgi:hypothetical protein